MILSNGMIKITDFGVATALNSTQLTQTNSVMGTVHYLPPEQANGKGSTIRSDIYSMGIMMYELLTGLVPYKGDNAVEIALKHLKEPLPSVRKFNSSIPQSIENVIIKATAKNPKNRYTDARAMHEDLKTALDESRQNEKRYVYPYPENDLEETKVLDKELETLKKDEPAKKKKVKASEDDDFLDENKKGNKTLIVIASIFTALVLTVTIGMTIYFEKTKVKNVEIPNVVNKEPTEAANELTDLGFDVEPEYKYTPSDTVEKGKVVKTSPEIGSKRKSGTRVIIYISSGVAAYIVEDFTGKNYLEAKGKIEAQCECNVTVEEEIVSEDKKVTEDTVLRTEPAAGESSKLGSQIKIFIPKVEYKYPDFTSGYTLEQIEEFASKHELKLEYKYQESATVTEGTIIKQSRAAKSVVTPGATLVITIAKAPESITEGDPNDETGD